jgi:hypothetical protein
MVGMGGGMVRDDGRGFLYRRSVFADNGVNPHRAIDGRVARHDRSNPDRALARPGRVTSAFLAFDVGESAVES